MLPTMMATNYKYRHQHLITVCYRFHSVVSHNIEHYSKLLCTIVFYVFDFITYF